MQASIQLGMTPAQQRSQRVDLAHLRVALALAVAAGAIAVGVMGGVTRPSIPTGPTAPIVDAPGDWAIGGLELRYESISEPVDAAGSRAAVATDRTITDPLARARADLDRWTVGAPTITADSAEIDAAAARTQVTSLRAITDPVVRARSELAGWATR
jgi:hypothetical protein